MKKTILVSLVIVFIGTVIFFATRTSSNRVVSKDIQSKLPIENINYTIESKGDGLQVILREKALRYEDSESLTSEERYQMSEDEAISVIYSLGLKELDKLKIEWVKE